MSRITDLTANSSLAAGDLLVVVDIDDASMDATGTDKKLAVSDLTTYVRGITASAQAYPANPAATASLTLVMMGMGSSCKITPSSSGKVLLTLTGYAGTNTAVATLSLGGRFGTGTAPVNGAAVSGTRFGMASDASFRSTAAAFFIPFTLTDLLTLTPGTAYWFDIALQTAVGADTAQLFTLSYTALEIA